MMTLRLVKVYDDWEKKESIGIYEVELDEFDNPMTRSTFPVRIEWDVEDEEGAVAFLNMIQQAFTMPALEDDDFCTVIPF